MGAHIGAVKAACTTARTEKKVKLGRAHSTSWQERGHPLTYKPYGKLGSLQHKGNCSHADVMPGPSPGLVNKDSPLLLRRAMPSRDWAAIISTAIFSVLFDL